MSESDDTDVLLLIPPDHFLVRSSSDSDVSSDCVKTNYGSGQTGVISELVGHMQSLETRISAIESKDNSLDATLLNNSLDTQLQNSATAIFRQTLPRTRFSVSQTSSLQNTPVKPRQSSSVPSTPSGYSSSNRSNLCPNDMKSGHHFPVASGTNAFNANDNKTKHDLLMSYSDPSVVPSAYRSIGFPHATTVFSKREPYSRSVDYCTNTSNLYVKPCDQLHSMSSASNLPRATEQLHSCSKTVQEMELSEVDELLQEMEATDLELSKRINSASKHQYFKEQSNAIPSNKSNDTIANEEELARQQSINRKLEFQSNNSRLQSSDVLPTICQKKYIDAFPDISLPYDSFHLDETDKMISEFKTWEQSIQLQNLKTGEQRKIEGTDTEKNSDDLSNRSVPKAVDVKEDVKKKESTTEQNVVNVDDGIAISLSNAQMNLVQKNLDTVLPSGLTKYNIAVAPIHAECSVPRPVEVSKNSQQNGNIVAHDVPFVRCIAHASTNTDFLPRKSQRLLSLSDFWDNNDNKSHEEMIRIKLEEEKFRREHCEHLIQELQKRLLEQQEKVAVALRVDNEKNELITRLHSAWSKLKQHVQILESEHTNFKTNIKNISEKHQSEISEFQSQIKRCEGELSKALDLAAGYKEKSDGMIKEKVNLLKSHADELENYKSLVQAAENRYGQLKDEYNKLLEKNQQSEAALKNVQQELGKERFKGGEVRNEMNVIHKALDTCDAELTVLRQEKESLQLKLKEEVNRNTILQQKNSSLLSLIDDAKMAEKLAKDETKSVAEQKEKIRSELQEVYQKQVDEVVKTKLQEFQTQLDAAESEFLEELKTRQQVIAECAARKIKDVIDKHRLEINLLEEKHKEEKRLCEIQLAQAAQKSCILETQLNSQRATKSQLAEQLHSVMQKQWQQALQIISGGSVENLTPLQRIHAEKFFESKGPRKSESMPNCCTRIPPDSLKIAPETKNFHSGREQQNDSLSTVTPINETPLTSRKESKDDLRKYIKMIAEMQQPREEFFKCSETPPSPPLGCREVPRKHYLKKELSILSEDSILWQPASEASGNDVSEYIPISQKLISKLDQQKYKPPWK